MLAASAARFPKTKEQQARRLLLTKIPEMEAID